MGLDKRKLLQQLVHTIAQAGLPLATLVSVSDKCDRDRVACAEGLPGASADQDEVGDVSGLTGVK
jgi:hypothetical protein